MNNNTFFFLSFYIFKKSTSAELSSAGGSIFPVWLTSIRPALSLTCSTLCGRHMRNVPGVWMEELPFCQCIAYGENHTGLGVIKLMPLAGKWRRSACNCWTVSSISFQSAVSLSCICVRERERETERERERERERESS